MNADTDQAALKKAAFIAAAKVAGLSEQDGGYIEALNEALSAADKAMQADQEAFLAQRAYARPEEPASSGDTGGENAPAAADKADAGYCVSELIAAASIAAR